MELKAETASAQISPPLETSVVICAYSEDRWECLQAAVGSVLRQERRALEVIVVIDHNDALLERAASALCEAAAVVANSHERGLSGARNTGIEVARGDIIAFLDDDAVAEADWLGRLALRYADARVLGVGGAAVPFWTAGKPEWFPDEFAWVIGCSYRGMPTALAPVRNLIGCNMSFRRAVFDAIGGFRADLGRVATVPAGCEETELCIRARQHWGHGIILYEPMARVHHRVPASRGTWRYFRERCYAEGLSKAIVSRWVGSGAGLASERSYVLRTLPLGVIRGVTAGLAGLRPAGLARAAAIVSGLALTTAGYTMGHLHGAVGGQPKKRAPV